MIKTIADFFGYLAVAVMLTFFFVPIELGIIDINDPNPTFLSKFIIISLYILSAPLFLPLIGISIVFHMIDGFIE